MAGKEYLSWCLQFGWTQGVPSFLAFVLKNKHATVDIEDYIEAPGDMPALNGNVLSFKGAGHDKAHGNVPVTAMFDVYPTQNPDFAGLLVVVTDAAGKEILRTTAEPTPEGGSDFWIRTW